MARYVVVEVQDNDLAEDLVAELSQDGDNVVGIFAKPTIFCPAAGGCSKGRLGVWVRGRKFGWWVCNNCKKPARVPNEKMMRHVITQGRNLLTQPLTAEELNPPSQVADSVDDGWGVIARGR